MTNLDIDEEENESFVFDGDIEEVNNGYDLCLVGRFLTERTIYMRAMKSKMADVWKPMMGINIKELEQGIYLFQFFQAENLQWVIKGGPWSFDNAMLVLEQVPTGEEPLNVQLWHINIWLQIHDLPMGFMSEAVGQQLGNFFEEFLQYDAKNDSSIWRECMRIRIRLDVRKPLKRKKKIVKKDGKEFTITCKYERLKDFCFSCGMVSHTDRFCRKALDNKGNEGEKEWGTWLMAPPRRVAHQGHSCWLRDEGDDTWESKIGRNNDYHKSRGENYSKKGKEISKESNSRSLVVTESRDISIDKKLAGLNTTSNVLYGFNEEDGIGLKTDGRKRCKEDSSVIGFINIDMGLTKYGPHITDKNLEAAISKGDLSVSSQSSLATLAVQASHSQ